MAKLAAPKLREALTDLNFNVRQIAFYALQTMNEDPQPTLRKHLEAKDTATRIPAAALLFVHGGDGKALPVLREGLKEKNPDLQMQAAFALAQRMQDGKEVTPVLIAGLRSKSMGVRQQALQGLQQLGRGGSLGAPALLEFLQNETEPNLKQQ